MAGCQRGWLCVISVLNDCKYGCDVHNGRIGLTMLKPATYPNPVRLDKEHHSFIWSLCPHSGRWQENQIVAKAYLLNNPYRAVIKQKDGGSLAKTYSAVSVNVPNVVIEVVKKAVGMEMKRLSVCMSAGTEEAALNYSCPNRQNMFMKPIFWKKSRKKFR